MGRGVEVARRNDGMHRSHTPTRSRPTRASSPRFSSLPRGGDTEPRPRRPESSEPPACVPTRQGVPAKTATAPLRSSRAGPVDVRSGAIRADAAGEPAHERVEVVECHPTLAPEGNARGPGDDGWRLSRRLRHRPGRTVDLRPRRSAGRQDPTPRPIPVATSGTASRRSGSAMPKGTARADRWNRPRPRRLDLRPRA